jgi:glycosyltransferase involved in cell wall biosynthesis
MLLSIIVPFYNSGRKCERLLKTLGDLEDARVELVLINDGSSDETPALLDQFVARSQLQCRVIHQENRGPGGARNAGLASAAGAYVWFVDSDDDINPSVIGSLASLCEEEFDLIDFDYLSRGKKVNTMGLAPGGYRDAGQIQSTLLVNFGRIFTKIISRRLILDNDIRYPEHCIYEDNALLFIYPFYVKSLYKSDLVGYIHCEDYESVTRSGFSTRYLDRMYTAVFGLSRAQELAGPQELDLLKRKFLRLYLLSTARKMINRKSGVSWRLVARVMRQYRADAARLEVDFNPTSYFKGSLRRELIFFLLWHASGLLPDQRQFFEDSRAAAWGK